MSINVKIFVGQWKITQKWQKTIYAFKNVNRFLKKALALSPPHLSLSILYAGTSPLPSHHPLPKVVVTHPPDHHCPSPLAVDSPVSHCCRLSWPPTASHQLPLNPPACLLIVNHQPLFANLLAATSLFYATNLPDCCHHWPPPVALTTVSGYLNKLPPPPLFSPQLPLLSEILGAIKHLKTFSGLQPNK